MRIFFSVGEPSGDIHGANLIRDLQALRPGTECVGYGGENMENAGCQLHFPLSHLAVMGFSRVLAMLPQFMKLISQTDRYFCHHRPDAVVLIDYPGFNWWIARRAHYHRIPVYYFVPPQIWAWASWRVRRMQRWVDHVLCSLPFEESWYRERGVAAEYVGHPFFDELPRQQLDNEFISEQRQKPGTIIGLLPGSRTMEVERNFRSQLQTAVRIHQSRPDTRFMVASFKPSHQKLVQEMAMEFPSLPLLTFVKKTPEIIELSKFCIAVSGSVSMELLYRTKPAVIVYRASWLMAKLIRSQLKVKYITLVNLLADKRLFPEFASEFCEAEGASREALYWLNDEQAYAGLCRELLALRELVAKPGACRRAAMKIIETLESRQVIAA